MTYFFILGNNPSLSIAEIIHVLSVKEKNFKIEKISKQVLIIKTKKIINYQVLQKQLGGTIKIGQVIEKVKMADLENVTSEGIQQIMALIPLNFTKVYFGFSLYDLIKKTKAANQGKPAYYLIKHIALKVKKQLKEQGISSRWVTSKEKILSSVIVQKNKLLVQGVEIDFLLDQGEIWLGKTLTCQEFAQYSFYDFARPKRLIEKGMLPPKLAQIMINLASNEPVFFEKLVFLDPFCGTGTILQQAVFSGYRKIIGTDQDKTAVLNTKENLAWLKNELKISFKEIIIFQSKVEKISQKLASRSIDLIVTEPYLGPIKFKTAAINSIIKELSQLYLKAFGEFKKILKPNGRIVIIFPVFKTKTKQQFLLILDTLKKMGWQIEPVIPHPLLKNPIIKVTDRQSIIYSRPDQRVLREIFVFKLRI
ncbi:methyltransferase domain-containing protein [Patescibacteria group bacterium]|nr:methyltransferase domain-containing protein [Patescibacteria group bacterium]